MQIIRFIFLGLLLPIFYASSAQQLAFPEAEGYGKYTRGGRSGSVVEVTNLNDSGSGSLRQALTSNKGTKRTIVFKVSGVIILKSIIEVKYDSLITIAGQTAPGDGICIRDYPITFSDSKQIIVRYIRSRLGDQQNCVSPDCDIDAISVRKCHHIIIDHCSFSWSIDALIDLTVETGYSTVQYCLISEALLNSKHSKGAHSMGTGWDGNSHGDNGVFAGGSYHHNLIASCNTRTPRIDSYAGENNAGSRDLLDIVNNVIYNWAGNGAYGGENADVNWQNNYHKYGPSTGGTTGGKKDQIFQADGMCKMYLAGNYVDGYPTVTTTNSGGLYVKGSKAIPSQLDTILKSTPFSVVSINMQTALVAYANVLANAGATLPKRDATDARIVQEVTNRSGKIIDSQSEVGGWASYNSTTAPIDTDHDGMPDGWETQNGLDKSNASDRNTIDTEGYTMLEKYMNSIGTMYSITTSTSGQGSVSIIPTGTSFLLGSKIQMVALPAKDWIFEGWTGDVTSTNDTVPFEVYKNATVNAQFKLAPDSTITATKDREEITLVDCYPNPAHHETSIRFNLPQSAQVNISLYDTVGKQVSLIAEQYFKSGVNEVKFKTSDFHPGLYLFRITSNKITITRKIVIK